MQKLMGLLPQKRRKDAVLAVEYLMTASPDWWKNASSEQQDVFFKNSYAWLAKSTVQIASSLPPSTVMKRLLTSVLLSCH